MFFEKRVHTIYSQNTMVSQDVPSGQNTPLRWKTGGPPLMTTKRHRQWATALWFEGKRRKIPKTRKEHTLWCKRCREYHRFMVYATWEWLPVEVGIGYDKFLETTIRKYAPWVTSHFMEPRSIEIFMGRKPSKWWTDATPEHVAELAKDYYFAG